MSAAIVTLLALAPAVGLLLPFESGLRFQAVVIVTVLLFVAWRRRWSLSTSLASLPAGFRWGLTLYLVAAAWGVAVGVTSGNAVRDVVAQGLAMLLLPAAAVIFASAEGLSGRALIQGLLVATVVALGLYLAFVHWPGEGSRAAAGVVDAFRFALAPGVTLMGSGLLVLLLALARGRSSLGPLTILSAAAGLALVLGSFSRGQWAAALAGAFVLVWLAPGWRLRTATIALPAAVLATIGLVGGDGGAESSLIARVDLTPRTGVSEGPASPWAAQPGVLALPDEPGHRSLRLLDRAECSGVRAVELRSRVRGEPKAMARFRLAGMDAEGHLVLDAWLPVSGTDGWVRPHAVVFLPPEVTTLALGVWSNRGQWYLGEAELWGLDSRSRAIWGWLRGWPIRVDFEGRELSAPWRWLEALSGRIGLLGSALEDPASDSGLDYRIREWRAIRTHWAAAPWWRKLVGQGLGARFAFANPSWDAAGRSVQRPTASYVHNLYVFYAFKLGVAGAAALFGLLAVAGWTLRRAWRSQSAPEDWWLPAGAAASWIAYLVWGLTSPEVVDFRVAPLLGLLVSACSAETAVADPGRRAGG